MLLYVIPFLWLVCSAPLDNTFDTSILLSRRFPLFSVVHNAYSQLDQIYNQQVRPFIVLLVRLLWPLLTSDSSLLLRPKPPIRPPQVSVQSSLSTQPLHLHNVLRFSIRLHLLWQTYLIHILPHMQFLFVGSDRCYRLPSAHTSRCKPCRSLQSCPEQADLGTLTHQTAHMLSAQKDQKINTEFLVFS